MIREAALPCPRHPALAVTDFPGKGRGVIATAAIPAGAVIEVAPVLVIPKKELSHIEHTFLYRYLFRWFDDAAPEEHSDYAMVLGVTSLINHAPDPNLDWECDTEMRTLAPSSIRAIQAGEELTIDYGCELWFEAAE